MNVSRKNPRYEFPEEVIAVLECSPNLEPCEEFRHADIYAFAKHLNERKCEQCVALFRVDREGRKEGKGSMKMRRILVAMFCLAPTSAFARTVTVAGAQCRSVLKEFTPIHTDAD